MKVISVHQPWASLIVAGIKDVENRSWRTDYRGELGIHAAAAADWDALLTYRHLLDEEPILGALIGSVTLVDCIVNSQSFWAASGSWHWVLSGAKKFARSTPMPGHRGLWEYGDMAE